jgi:hypothetical protein
MCNFGREEMLVLGSKLVDAWQACLSSGRGSAKVESVVWKRIGVFAFEKSFLVFTLELAVALLLFVL